MTAFGANFVLVNLVLNNEKYAIFHVEYLRVWPLKQILLKNNCL